MKVRCITTYPTEAHIAEFGDGFYRAQSFGLVRGEEYPVLGILFQVSNNILGTGVALALSPDERYVVYAPLPLFEVTDPSVPSDWEIATFGHQVTCLAPQELKEPYFRDRLSDDEPRAVEALKSLLRRYK